MDKWIEQSNTGGWAIYRRGNNMEYLLVGFNRESGRITIQQYVYARRRYEQCDNYYSITPPSLTTEDIAFIHDKAKELFQGAK